MRSDKRKRSSSSCRTCILDIANGYRLPTIGHTGCVVYLVKQWCGFSTFTRVHKVPTVYELLDCIYCAWYNLTNDSTYLEAKKERGS